MMMGQGFGFGGYGMMGGGSLMMIIIIAAVGFIVYLALKKQAPAAKDASLTPPPAVESEALRIAKTRLANGEISVEEFEQIKKNLF